MKKKLLSVLLALSLCAALFPAALAAGSKFSDVPAGSWFEQGVQTCAEKGVMIGTAENAFSPDTALTIAQCLTLALRLYDLQRGGTGALEKAPGDWGVVVVTLADGTVVRGQQAEDIFFQASRLDPRGGKVLTFSREPALLGQGWAADGTQKATVTLNGTVIPGTAQREGHADDGARQVVNFRPDDPAVSAVIEEFFLQTHPKAELWYRDTVYSAEKWGLSDWENCPGVAGLVQSLLNSPDGDAARYEFAAALAEAAGELPKLCTVERLPDVPADQLYAEEIFSLYEGGILNGVDDSGTFGYYGALTRAQAATMVARVLDEAQRVTPKATATYAGAVAELRAKTGYHNERLFETDICTVVVYDQGGFMNAPTGAMAVIYKAGSARGEGTVVDLPFPRAKALNVPTPADHMELSADKKSFTYSYHFDQPLEMNGQVLRPAGDFVYTVDLASGEVTLQAPETESGSYARTLEALTKAPGFTVEKTLEAAPCTVVLGYALAGSGQRSYALYLVMRDGNPRGNGSYASLTLPITLEDGYLTHRAPDRLECSEEKDLLTVVYNETVFDGSPCASEYQLSTGMRM